MAAEPPPRSVAPIRWDGRALRVLDQTRLPQEESWLTLRSAAETASAIARLAVRGAPNIGIAAAYGIALDVAARPGLGTLEQAADVLVASRPTAVNLAWAVEQVRTAAMAATPATLVSTVRGTAQRIQADEDAAAARIAEHGRGVLPGARRPMTHCNAGALACGGAGTALAVVLGLPDLEHVLACETRPLLQGARLTAWELDRVGVPFHVCVDGAAAGLIRRGEVDAVVVGCDRVAANGDVANKVGTYAHALAARAAGIPFVVAGPTSTIDLATPTGDAIVLEERDATEVSDRWPARNPAFDVTPAELVTALVTERGIARPVDAAAVAALVA